MLFLQVEKSFQKDLFPTISKVRHGPSLGMGPWAQIDSHLWPELRPWSGVELTVDVLYAVADGSFLSSVWCLAKAGEDFVSWLRAGLSRSHL